jgi:putative flippase GtrA
MNSEIFRIALFAIIGVWNTVFDFAIFIGLLNSLGKLPFWKTSKIKAATVCHILSFLGSNSVSYVLNNWFTFNGGQSRGFLAYFTVTLISLSISTTFIQIFNSQKYSIWFEKTILAKLKTYPIIHRIKLTEKTWPILLKLGSVAISMTINYLGYRNLVFVGIR